MVGPSGTPRGGSAPPLVLATRSTGKVRELRALCEAAGVDAESLAEAGLAPSPEEEDVETGRTFAENAARKARHYAARLPGRAVLAEDSGLVVDALGGGPGIWSKRWSWWPPALRDAILEALRAGRAEEAHALVAQAPPATGDPGAAANNAALLAALEAVGAREDAARGAAYACAAVLRLPDGYESTASGRTAGTILAAPSGAGGFGYDPYFRSAELGVAFGAASAAAKAGVSHRARAVRPLLARFAGERA